MPENILTRLSGAFADTSNAATKIADIQERRQAMEERKQQLQMTQQVGALNFYDSAVKFIQKLPDDKSKKAYIEKIEPVLSGFSRHFDPTGQFTFSLEPFKTSAGAKAYDLVKRSIDNPNDPTIDPADLRAAIPLLDPEGDPIKGAQAYAQLKAFSKKVKGLQGEDTTFGEAKTLVEGSGGGLQISPTPEGELSLGKKTSFSNRANAVVSTFQKIAESQMNVLKGRYQGQGIPRDALMKVQEGSIRTTADLLGLGEDEVRSALSSLSETGTSKITPSSETPLPATPGATPAKTPTATPTAAPTRQPTTGLEPTSSGLSGAPLNKVDRSTQTAISTIANQLPALQRMSFVLDKIEKENKGADIGYIQGQLYRAGSKYFNLTDPTLEEFLNRSGKQVMDTLYEKSGKQTNEIERKQFEQLIIPGVLQNLDQARTRLRSLQQEYADRALGTISTALSSKMDVSGNLGLLKSLAPYMTVENADRVYDVLVKLKEFGLYTGNKSVDAFEETLRKTNPETFNALVKIYKEESARGAP